MANIKDEAFVTFAATNNYAIGALTLASSLKSLNTNKQLCIIITNDICISIRFVRISSSDLLFQYVNLEF